MAKRRIEVVFRRQDIPPETVAGRACAVIDVLRAGTSAAYALAAGAGEIRLFRHVNEAREARRGFGGGAVLAGERGGLRPEGFDLGNSPTDFAPEAVSGKTLFFTTTNGTAALAGCARARFVAFAGLVNAGPVAGALARRAEDVLLVCAGTEGRSSAEDVLCAGVIAGKVGAILHAGGAGGAGAAALTDAALVAVDFARFHQENPRRVVRASDHGMRLAGLGLGSDVDACSEVDSLDVTPVLRRGPLRLVRGAGAGAEEG